MSSPKAPTLSLLRRYAIARSLFKPTSLPRAIARLGFVQADPMRAPARAQDLILAHRVRDYRAGELERRYPRLPIEEAFFINYGFLPHVSLGLLYPRAAPRGWDARMQARAKEVLAFVRAHGRTYPRDVRAHFEHGRIKRWGGALDVSAHLLEGLPAELLGLIADGSALSAADLAAQLVDGEVASAQWEAEILKVLVELERLGLLEPEKD